MFEKAFTVYARIPEKKLEFTLNWKGIQLNIEVSTHGKIKIDNIETLAQSDQTIFRHAITLADRIKDSTANRQTHIQDLRTQLTTHQRRRTPAKLTTLTSKGENPFDYYYVGIPSPLPKIFGDAVPAMNIFVLFIASMFLIPGIASTSTGVIAAITLSTLALMIQLLSKPLEKKIGAAKNRYIQDVVSATILSISSFSAIRMLATIFVNRALVLANKDQNIETNFIAGVAVITLASMGTIGAWFVPSVTVMGPRVQATAIKIERSFLKDKENPNLAARQQLIKNSKSNEGRSLAQRFCLCIRTKKIATDMRYDERVILPPSMLVVGKRLGGAFVLSTQLSLTLGINPRVFETALIPLAALSLLHPFVNRKFEIMAGHRPIVTIPALSDKALYTAQGLKWISELAGVSYNSLINPAITLFFVCEKVLSVYNIGNNEHSTIGRINGSLLAIALLTMITSLILDLASRRLGIDRFEGWSPSRLSYILDEAESVSIRNNLEQYLSLVIETAWQQTTSSVPESSTEQTFYAHNTIRHRLGLGSNLQRVTAEQ